MGDGHFVREEISSHHVVHQELTALRINYTSKTNTKANSYRKRVRYAVSGVRFGDRELDGGSQMYRLRNMRVRAITSNPHTHLTLLHIATKAVERANPEFLSLGKISFILHLYETTDVH